MVCITGRRRGAFRPPTDVMEGAVPTVSGWCPELALHVRFLLSIQPPTITRTVFVIHIFSCSTVASTIPASQNCTVSYSHSMIPYRCLPPCYFVVATTDALLVSPAVPSPCSFISYVMSPAWCLSNSHSFPILLGPLSY